MERVQKLHSVCYVIELILVLSYVANSNSEFSWEEFQWRFARNVVVNGEITPGLYKIQNVEDGKFMTAVDGKIYPGIVTEASWRNGLPQLWDVTRIGKGHVLKPLKNDFNLVTSHLRNNAHAYNVYEFKQVGMNHWLMLNIVENRCLTVSSSGSASTHKRIKNAECDQNDLSQQWKFYFVDV